MIRWLATLVFSMMAPFVFAQEPMRPFIGAELESDTAIPGQPVTMRLTILVPTWMPKPPVLPDFDVPNLMVRLPPRSTHPVSRRVDGETWSGITRIYRFYPLVEGVVRIGPQLVSLQYADPKTSKPVSAELPTPAFTITGSIPENGAGLDPFIAASALRLEQEIEGNPDDLEPGDAIKRQVRLHIEGASPMMVPPLVAEQAMRGLAAYDAEPVLEEKAEGAVLSGTRLEEITYVAEAGGRFALAPISVRWYNQTRDRIETARVEGIDLTVRGPPPVDMPERDWRADLGRWASALVLIGIAALAMWRLRKPIAAWRKRREAAYLDSEKYALRQARRALGDRQLSSALRTTASWWHCRDRSRAPIPEALAEPLRRIGAALYGHRRPDRQVDPKIWQSAVRAFHTLAREKQGVWMRAGGAGLPPLNPTQPAIAPRNDP